MGAALAPIGEGLAGLTRAAVGSIVGSGAGKFAHGIDKATATVRSGRFLYAAGATYTLGLWYWGWRNERVTAGSGTFPIPYLFKGDKIQDGAPDADDPGAVDISPWSGNDPASFGSGTGTQSNPSAGGGAALGRGAGGLGQLPQKGVNGNKTLLVQLGHYAEQAYGLHASEQSSFGGVHPVHVANSLHYKDRAIDASANPVNSATLGHAAAFAHYLVANYLNVMTEVIWNGPSPIFVKNGQIVPASTYAAVLATHKTHVHFAI